MTTLIENLTSMIDKSIISNKDPKISYIIGDNGSGKSRLLSEICDYYEDDTNSLINSILCITTAASDRFTFGDGRIRRYLGLRTSSNAIFSSALSRQMAILVLESVAHGRYKHLVELEKTLEKKFHIDFGDTENLNPDNLASTIDRRRIKPEKFNKDFSTANRNKIIEILKEGLNLRRLGPDDANLIVSYLKTRPSVTLYLKDEDSAHSFEELSSGERNLISLGLKIISHASKRALILIDEPEISLHLQWQMEFHKNLIKMLEPYRNYHVVIATHSPVLVSEAARTSRTDTIFVLKGAHENSNLDLIDRNFKIIESDEIRSCDDLTLMHFHTPTYNSKAIDIRIAELVLDATSTTPSDDSIIKLEELKNTDNLQGDKQSTIEQALELIQMRNTRKTNEKPS